MLSNNLLLFLFVVGFLISPAAEGVNHRRKMLILFVSCVILAIGAGYRSFYWMDTFRYIEFFLSNRYTPTISEYSFGDPPKGYDEQGFFFLSIIIKTFTDDVYAYFLVISLLTMFILYDDLRKYSPYPLMGLLCYVSRFYCGRNLVQIRSALSYVIIVWGLQYVYKKEFVKFLLVVFIAYHFHHSALIALPFYFVCNTIKLRRKHIMVGLAIAFILGTFFQGPISSFVTDTANDLNVATTYVQGAYVSKAKGMLNPQIYFQVVLLLAFVFLEKELAPRYAYYYIFRNGYWYSTLILITFCSFTALSGRTSTQFATLEFAIIPTLIFHLPKNYRIMALSVLCGIMAFFLWNNMRVGMWTA